MYLYIYIIILLISIFILQQIKNSNLKKKIIKYNKILPEYVRRRRTFSDSVTEQ